MGFTADLGFAWASRLSQVDSVSALFLSRPDPVSALSLPPQIWSQLERRRWWDHAVTRWRICRRRRVLIGDGGFVGWLAEVVVGFLSIPVMLGCDSSGVGVCFTCVFLHFTLHQIL